MKYSLPKHIGFLLGGCCGETLSKKGLLLALFWCICGRPSVRECSSALLGNLHGKLTLLTTNYFTLEDVKLQQSYPKEKCSLVWKLHRRNYFFSSVQPPVFQKLQSWWGHCTKQDYLVSKAISKIKCNTFSESIMTNWYLIYSSFPFLLCPEIVCSFSS